MTDRCERNGDRDPRVRVSVCACACVKVTEFWFEAGAAFSRLRFFVSPSLDPTPSRIWVAAAYRVSQGAEMKCTAVVE